MTAPRRVGAFIYVGGERLDFFTDYTVAQHLMKGADDFRFSAPLIRADREASRAALAKVVPGAVVDIKVVDDDGNEAQVLHGRIDSVEVETAKGGSFAHVSGRSHSAVVVDGDVLPFAGLSSITLADLVFKVAGDFGYARSDVLVDNSANRSIYTGGKAQTVAASTAIAGSAVAARLGALKAQLDAGHPVGYAAQAVAHIQKSAVAHALAGVPLTPDEQDALNVDDASAFIATQPTAQALGALKVDQAYPRAGETGWQFLVRHCRRFGLLIWGTCDGKLVVGRPNYDQPAIYEVRCMSADPDRARNNVRSISRHHSFLNVPSEVHVYGHTFGHDFANSSVQAVVVDDELVAAGFHRLLTVHDGDARTKQQADARAQYEMSARRQGSDVVSVQVRRHSDRETRAVYGVDTICNVRWDAAGLDGPRYVLSRTFELSGKVRTTRLELIPKGTIALEPSI